MNRLSAANSTTAAYYDRLSSWTATARYLGYGGGRGTLTVHRALVDPRAQGRPTPTRLHDLIVDLVMAQALAGPSRTSEDHLPGQPPSPSHGQRPSAPRATPRVLDAGCGLAGTMIDLATRVGGDYTGLTLSEAQARTAREAIARHGLSSSIRVFVQDYDHPPEGPFDIILAVESIAHSPDPARTARGLIDRLAVGDRLDVRNRVPETGGAAQSAPPAPGSAGAEGRGGLFIVVDDMPKPCATADAAADLATFKAGWRCPVLWTADEYVGLFAARELRLVADRDLTMDVVPRSLGSIARLERLNRLLAQAVPLASWRSVLASHAGGLALERLYRRGLVTYRMLAARR